MIFLCTLASSVFFRCSFVFDWSFHHALQSSNCFSIVSRTSSPFGTVDCRSKKNTPKKWPGGVGCPHFVEPNLTFGAPDLYRMNEEPTTNLARGFLYKIRVPNLFFGARLWFSQPLASTKWEAWHEQTFKQNYYLEERKPSKIQRSIL